MEDDANWDDDELVDCPHCGQEIYEDAERCPHCEMYVTDFDSPTTSRPKWVVATAVLLLLVMAYFLLAPIL